MKKFYLLLTILSLCVSVQAQKKNSDKGDKNKAPQNSAAAAETKTMRSIDFKVKPKVAELRDVEFPRYSETTLKNGLKVFVIEDHKQPTIAFRLQVGAGDAMDGTKNGLSYLMTNLIYKGTQKRSAAEVSNQIDSVGASLSSSSQGELMTISIDGLKRHSSLLLSIFADVVQNPLFPKEELDKMMPQVMAALKQERSNPASLSGALSRIVLYGKDHPSAQRRTEESLKAISLEDIRNFHERYVRPNNRATLAVVGDVSLNEIVPLLEKAFANWKPTTMAISQTPAPKPMPRGIYFVQRPGSVQTSLMCCSLIPGRKDESYEPLQLASSLLGSGFAGRLFKTLRETYSFTYTPFAAVTQGKYFNRFIAGADVRNAVTDSALMVLQSEIGKVADDAASDEEFNVIRTYEVGNYLMAFENSEYVASLLQNAEYLGLSPEYVKSYSKRLNAYTPFDAQKAAKKFIRPDQLYTIVVGSPDIAPVLAKYGRVYNYNLDLQPVGDNVEKVNMSPDELMKKVQQGIGGLDKMNAIKTLHVKATSIMSMGGKNVDGSGERKMKAPNKKYTGLKTPFGNQEYFVNGTKGWISMAGQPADEMDEKTLKSAITEAGPFYYAHLTELGYTCSITGKINGQIVVKATSPAGTMVEFYYDAQSYLLSRVDQTQETGQGPMTITERYENYTDISGVKLPLTEKMEIPNGISIVSKVSYEANVPFADTDFEPQTIAPMDINANPKR